MKEITLSLGRLAIAIVLATIVDAIVLAATSNGVMSIVLIPFLMFFFIYLICRKRISMLTRVLAALLAILVVALCIRFGKIAKPVLKQDIDTNTSVTQEDKKEDSPMTISVSDSASASVLKKSSIAITPFFWMSRYFSHPVRNRAEQMTVKAINIFFISLVLCGIRTQG